jgi:transcriptional regulator with XRE-family HTH domain
MTINKSNHNPSPEYLRGLIESAGISQREAARRLKIDERTIRRYLTLSTNKSYIECPYVVQYALENL